MHAYFSLWDTDSRNIVDTFEDGSEALRVAHGLIEANGADYADMLDLSWTSVDDQTQHIATGKALIALTRGADVRRSRPRRVAAVYRRRRVIRDTEREPVAN